MKVGVYSNTERDQRVIDALEAFKTGLNHLGVDWFFGGSVYRQPCDVAVIWGIASERFPHTNYRDMIRMAQPNTIVMERGFVKRDEYYAAGWGDTGGYADFCNKGMPSDRWEALGVELQPMKEDGDYILVLGQVPWDTAVQHIDYPRWLKDTVATLTSAEDLRVRLRNHPLLPETKRFSFPKCEVSYKKTLEEDFAGASQVIACNSTGLVDATIAGVPTIACDGRAMCPAPGASREQWGADIAYAQWTLDEFRSGKAFEHLVKGRGL